MERSSFEAAQRIQSELAEFFRPEIEAGMALIKMEMDPEIETEIRERIAVMMFDELVNDLPMVPYLAVWEDGNNEILHAYMSPKIEALCEYSPQELLKVGYINIVKGNIISFYRETSGVEEKITPVAEVKANRVAGFLENRNWEGCYRIEKKNGEQVWVIDRSAITRFRNSVNNNVICVSAGILLETTELFERRKDRQE
ncbi:MAG: hypothetical protein M0036_08350 [Desulfobacteraceae bacterium]|nr:hypothetical protein [Desulfobacteraceae bacterium]